MTTATELSPMQVYEAKLATLSSIRISIDNQDALEMLDEAIASWQSNHRGTAVHQEYRYRTRFYCTICYGEISQMQEVQVRGGGKAHRVCEHLYQFDMAKLRKQIKAQQFEHDPQALWHYRDEVCPALTEGWPTLHPKRTVFEEPR